jgi:MOSC domain-containing protein YiiM
MKLISLNISMPVSTSYMGRTFETGIFKNPVEGPIMLRSWPNNLDGDGQGNLRSHGTEHKAVYAYPIEHYSYWQKELGCAEFQFGQFGENFTVQGMLETEVHIGDVFRFGDAEVEVTQPRSPCYKLGMKMGIPDFQDLFIKSQLTGFYMRVLKEGNVWPNSEVNRIKVGDEKLSVNHIHALRFHGRNDIKELKKALTVSALSKELRRQLEALLQNTNRTAN